MRLWTKNVAEYCKSKYINLKMLNWYLQNKSTSTKLHMYMLVNCKNKALVRAASITHAKQQLCRSILFNKNIKLILKRSAKQSKRAIRKCCVRIKPENIQSLSFKKTPPYFSINVLEIIS